MGLVVGKSVMSKRASEKKLSVVQCLPRGDISNRNYNTKESKLLPLATVSLNADCVGDDAVATS